MTDANMVTSVAPITAAIDFSDNTAALSANTTKSAMDLSAYNCDRGDDDLCINKFGAGHCCFMAAVASSAEEIAARTDT